MVGERSVSTSRSRRIDRLLVETGKKIRELPGHEYITNEAAFSPDGRFIASVGQDDTLRVWNVSSGKEVWHQDDPAWWTRYGPKGTLITGAPDAVRIRDADTGKKLRHIGEPLKPNPNGFPRLPPGARNGEFKTFALSADGKLLATIRNDETVELWDPATTKKIGEFREWLCGHRPIAIGFAASPTACKTPRESAVGKVPSRFTSVASWDRGATITLPVQLMISVVSTPEERHRRDKCGSDGPSFHSPTAISWLSSKRSHR